MNSKKLLKNQKGIALLMAIFCVMIMAFLSVEIAYDTSVEYALSSQEYGRIKAYEAARSGVELSLLRIQLYKNVLSTMGEQLKGQEAYTQMIWSFPFMWPPQIPSGTSITDKDQIQEAVGDSFMDATYQVSISSEGSKIDINDLDSPSEALRNSIRNQLLTLLKNKLESDDEWRNEYQEQDFEEIINNIQDWVDEDQVSLNGGAESAKYSNKDPNHTIPPNRPFQTLDELRSVAGMTEEVFHFLLPHITIYGVKGINVNQASRELLKSIDSILTDEVVDEVMERRNSPEKGGPFQNDEDFTSFIGAHPEQFNPSRIPLYYGNEYNFRVRSIGIYQKVRREIIAIVYDVEGTRDRLKEVLDRDIEEKNPSDTKPEPPKGEDPNSPNQPNQPNKPALSAEKPRIVYWYEN